MKLTTSLLLILLFLVASPRLTTAKGKTDTNAPQRVSATRNHSRSATAETILNLTDFGALGDGATDDGPALQSALDTLAELGGGTLFVPAGRYAIVTPVGKDFTGLATSITILGVESLTPVPAPDSSGDTLTRGLDLLSDFAPRTDFAIAINLTGLQSLLIKDITFIGTPDVATDAWVTLALHDIAEATIRHCEFYGLSSQIIGGAVVLGVRSNLTLEQSVFLGCSGNSAVLNPVVQNLQWKSVTVSSTIFMDYGQRPELFGKLSLGTPASWVNIGNAAAPDSNSPRREAVIKNVFFDEGGLFGLAVLPYISLPPSAPIDLVYVSGLHMNVSNLNASGNYLKGVQRVLVEDSHYGWSQNADSALSLLEVDTAILERVECVASADRIRADSATNSLTVIDSTYNHLDSLAHTTRVINTNAVDEDPVQYVRQQFQNTLGREPDAAGHFFWSNRQLQCGEDSSCVAEQRAAFNAYLSTAPTANFSISGQVTVESGAGLPGVVVTLSGSQSVTTQTDSEGRYRFANLPTSGEYVVTPARVPYSFDPVTRIITTPSGNQIVNFAATLPRLEFSAPSYSVVEGTRNISVSVTRSGDTSTEAEVIFSGVDGTANQRSDVIPVMGRLNFAPGETSKSFVVFITDDAHVEGDESLMLELSDPVAGVLGTNSSAELSIVDNDSSETTTNPIDGAGFFVRQQYRDFLNRPADAAGFAFWTNQILSCGNDAACVADRRMNVSAAFFLSIEFQQTGFLVYRLYEASFAQAPKHLEEFLLDTRTIGAGVVVNASGWQDLLEANTTEFIESFVARPQFTEIYPPSLTPAEFVDLLNGKTGGALTPDDVAEAIAEFQGAATCESVALRARALRRVAESVTFSKRQLNPAFVRMQYFGYMQRNPDETPDTNLDGYNFWLHKLEEFDGDFRRADMVQSFLVSGEYRGRFGTP